MQKVLLLLAALLIIPTVNAESVFTEREIALMEVGVKSCNTAKIAPEIKELYSLVESKINPQDGFNPEVVEWLWVVAEEFQQQAVYSKSQIADLEKCRFSNADWHLEQARVHFQSSVFNRLVATN